jgi:arginase family enzyme
VRDSRGCLLEAGGQVDDALAAGDLPVLLAGDCSIAATTLPAVVRHHPDARFLWLDAHGDFNTPETSPSGYLGGMGLAAACGRWDPGLADPELALDPSRITLCGVRDLDPGERVALELAGVPGVARLSEVADLVQDAPVFVHLDLDVLDPSVLPAHFPAPLGLSLAGLHTVLLEVAAAATPIGIEITDFEAPEDPEERGLLASMIADAVEPLLAGARQEA